MKKINKIIIASIITINTILLIISLFKGEYKTIFDYLCVYPVFLAPIILNKYSITRLTEKEEFLYLLFVIFADFLGSVLNLYDIIDGFDTITHFVFGIASGALGIYILNKLKLYNNKRYYVMAFLFIVISLAAASAWEMYEFIADSLFNTNLQSVETGVVDTMKDMIVSTIGIIIFCIFYIRRFKSVPKRKIKRR